MFVDAEDSILRYCEQKTSVPSFAVRDKFWSPVSYACDLCGLTFDASLLNPVTIERAVYFCCVDCCRKVLTVDNWRSSSRAYLVDLCARTL